MHIVLIFFVLLILIFGSSSPTAVAYKAKAESDFHLRSPIKRTRSLFYKPACRISTRQIVAITVQSAKTLRPKPCHVDAVEMTAF